MSPSFSASLRPARAWPTSRATIRRSSDMGFPLRRSYQSACDGRAALSESREGPMILEVCIDGPEGLLAAQEGGADRVELCSALDIGGLSPSPALVTMASELDMPAVAMVRPRAG